MMKRSRSPSTAPAPARRLAAVLKRAGGALAISTIAAVSLLTFPAAVPWMVAGWLLWHTGLVMGGRPGWLPLAACAGILLVKRIPWMPGVIALGVAMLLAGVLGALRARRGHGPRAKPSAWAALLMLWITWTAMALDWHASARRSRAPALHPTRPVVCLGDSLTAGAAPHGGYPRDLQKLITVPVVNLGQPGITSADALQLLPALEKADPQVVVVELGGHDYLKGYGRASTKANLTRIIEASQRMGAVVVLVEIPRGVISDPYAGLERELARQHDLELISDTPIRWLVYWSPYAPPGMWLPSKWHFSDDGLHPNARGNRLLARYVAEALARLIGPESLASPSSSLPGERRQTNGGIER
jgi:lysophospholipase L1-like esterase